MDTFYDEIWRREMWASTKAVDSMFLNSSPCSQDTQTESSNFRTLEGIQGPHAQVRLAFDDSHKEFLYANSNSWERMMESIPQLRQALAVIENVCKTSSTVWVNKHQCKQMADRFSAVGEALKDLRWDRNLARSEPSDGGRNKDYPAFDELLTVLRKGESLVSYYNTWKGIGSAFGGIDNQEAFKEIQKELDIMKAQFDFEGLTDVGHGNNFESTSGLRWTPIPYTVIEKAEMDENLDRLVAIVRKLEQTAMDMDMDILGRGSSGYVHKTTCIGVPCAAKTFAGNYSPTRVLQQELDVFNKLSRHPYIAGHSVDSIVMDCMSGINLQELLESQRRRRSPVSKECVNSPLNFYCEVVDILLQTRMGMAILHSKGVAHSEHQPLNVLANKYPGPSIVIAELMDFGSSKVHGVYKGAGTGFWRAPERFEIADCPKLVDVYSFAIICSEVLTGSMWKTTLSKIIYSEEQEKFLKHWCDNDWRENGDARGYLQKEPLMSKVFLDLVHDVGTESNLEALEVSAFNTGGSGSEAIGTCQNSTKFVEDDEAQSSKAFSPCVVLNAAGSCAPEATSDSPTLVQQQSTEILSGLQMPEFLNYGEPARKRNRTRIWSDDEKRALLESMADILTPVDEGSYWDSVSENLWEQYSFDRASSSCQNLWGTLLQSYTAIRDHESKIHSGMSSCVSYLEMNEDERSNKKLLRAFDFEWCEMIERILSAKPFEDETRSIQMDADLPSSALPLCRIQSSAIYMDHFGSADCDDVLYDELTDSEIEEIDTQSEDEGLSGDSTATLESQAGDTADSHVTRTEQSHEPCYETNSKYAGRKRSGATVEEDDLISRIAPFVKKQIEDALKPLITVLRSGEDEQKHRDKMLAIEEEKLALKREKMQFTRRALANSNALRENLPQIHQNQNLARASTDIAPQ